MAVRFDAVSEDYSRALALGSQAALTACCWLKISTDRNTWSSAFFVDNGQADNWGVQTGADGTTVTVVLDGNSTNSLSATVGTWYFICLASSGTTGTLYYRAASATSLSTTAVSGVTATNAATLRLGRSPWDDEWLNGCLAGVKLWNVQLTQAEIELEAAQYTPNKVASLVSFHPLVRAETADYSGNARTLSGGTGTTTEDGPPIPWRGNSPRLILPAAAEAGITGTVAVTQADNTAIASGILGYSGTAAATQAAQTSSASGTVSGPVTGTAAITQADDTATASGLLRYSGAATPIQAPDTASASGVLRYSGTAVVTQADQTSTATGQLRYSGTVAATQAANTASASGVVTAGGEVIGTAAPIQADQTASATGLLRYSGTAAITQGSDTSTATGVLRYTGTVTAVQAAQTATASGVFFTPVTGTLSVVQANQTATATGSALGDIVERPFTGTTTRPSTGVTPRP